MLEQKFKPNKEKLKLTDISIDISQKQYDYVENKTDELAKKPQIYYNEFELYSGFITKMTIDFNSFMPTISFNYTDTMGLLLKSGLPIDDSKIKIMIPSNNKMLGNILMEFKIESYNIQTHGVTNVKKYDFVCILSINNILTSEYKSYTNKSSYEVFEEFAKNTGLGFVSNISSTNDRMTWVNFGIRNLEFLCDVRDHSWIGENSFVWAFIDPYYNLVLVDVEKSLSTDLNNVVWSYDEMFSAEGQPKNNVTTGPPILTNADHYKTSNLHIFDYNIVNSSTLISLQGGYRRNVHYYDLDGNWKDRAGHYHLYGLDTISTPGSESTKIYTRSDDNEFYEQNSRNIYGGVLDTKNVHPDYLWAKVQNEENVRDMGKFIVQVLLKSQNFNIKRFEGLQLQLVESTVTTTSEQDPVNDQLSNNYICIGFSFEWNTSGITQVVNLISREISLPNPIQP